MTEEILFISDLHLDQNKPDISLSFLNFIKTRAASARILYILGDLFEVWAGDDSPIEHFTEIFAALNNLSQSTEIYFIHGNRDFLVGEQLASINGFKIIQPPCIIQLGSRQVALLHGDELCTDDDAYQAFRKKVRATTWQDEFLARPLDERLAITSQLRAESNQEMTAKSDAIMDVNKQAVINIFDKYQVDTIIHGHTHRPAIHSYKHNLKRYVLGDWNPEPSYISWSEGSLKLFDSRVN